MRLSHFEAFEPRCPACLARGNVDARALLLTRREVHDSASVREGVLQCPACFAEFPIIDGIPVLVADARATVAANHAAFARRADLSDVVDGMLAECAGPGSWDLVTMQHVSGAAWDHYAEFDAAEGEGCGVDGEFRPGAIARIVGTAAKAGGIVQDGPSLDVGCGAGRSSFEIAARTQGLVLGIDMHVGTLRLAQRVLHESRVSYLRRSVGMLYERRAFDVAFAGAERVDFWMMDALNPCMGLGMGLGVGGDNHDTFANVVALNVLDCVASPLGLLQQLVRVLRAGGKLTVATPFDWSAGVTPVEAWIGGHSPRGFEAGQSDELLVKLLSPGMQPPHPASIAGMVVEQDLRAVPWHVRVHARSVMRYVLRMVVARRL